MIILPEDNEIISMLEEKDQAQLLRMLFSESGDASEASTAVKIAYTAIKGKSDRISLKHSGKGKGGGAPAGNENAKKTTKNNLNNIDAKKQLKQATVTDTVTDTVPKSSTSVDDKRARVPRRSIPPTVDEVNEYCIERNNKISPQYFVDYYTTRGWKLTTGKTMVDWQAAIRTWERSNFDTGKLTDKEKRERERNGRSEKAEHNVTDERHIGHAGTACQIDGERNAGTGENPQYREIDGDMQSGEQKAVSLKDFLERNPEYNQVWGVP